MKNAVFWEFPEDGAFLLGFLTRKREKTRENAEQRPDTRRIGEESMEFYRGFIEEIYEEIAVASENKQTIDDVKYERFIQVHSPKKIYAEIIDNDAFLMVYIKKGSFRIVGMATRKEAQGKGYGTLLLFRCIKHCQKKNLARIETRTLSGRSFYREKAGAKVVGVKDGDYLMVIDVPQRKGGNRQ